jgi:hypothetical protein
VPVRPERGWHRLTNAYPQLPATSSVGHHTSPTAPTRYADDAESGTEFITAKKDVSITPGWLRRLATASGARAVTARSYYVIDGQVGGGPAMDDRTWHQATGHRGEREMRVGAGTTQRDCQHIRLAHAELVHRGRNTDFDDGIYGFHASHITLSQSYPRFRTGAHPDVGVNDVTVEYSTRTQLQLPAVHSEGER